jgi:hypothetical protein
MIKFFRKIRFDLMEKNKTGKYLKYAIGEIVLVVIGILIALSINNWNESRKDSISELTALKDLRQEFSKNTIVFKEHHQFKINTTLKWVAFISKISDPNLTESNLTFRPTAIGVRTYNPSKSILNSILSTGKIDKVENDSLKYFLTDWNDILLDYMEDEARHLDFWDKEITVLERKLIPYRYYNVDSIDTLKNDFKSEIETKKLFLEAYSSLEYQNLLLRNVYFLQENVRNGEHILKTYKLINQLLEEEVKLKE